MISQDLLLVLQDGVLISNDPDLVGENGTEPILIPQDPFLRRDDDPVAREDLLLILDRCLRHRTLACVWTSVAAVIVGSYAQTLCPAWLFQSKGSGPEDAKNACIAYRCVWFDHDQLTDVGDFPPRPVRVTVPLQRWASGTSAAVGPGAVAPQWEQPK